MNGSTTKKGSNPAPRHREVSEPRTRYSFSKGVRGKYAAAYAAGEHLVRLDADVAEAFPTSDDVNRALRAILQAMPKSKPRSAKR